MKFLSIECRKTAALVSTFLGAALFAALPLKPVQAAVKLSNASTSLVVNGGEAGNGLVPFDGYFRYTDLGAAEETTWSVDPMLRFSDGSTAVLSVGGASGFESPSLASGVATSLATSGFVSTTAETTLIGSNAKTTFTFIAAPGTSLDGITFVFYAENDLFSFSDDAAAFTGSIAGRDLALFMYDSIVGELTVRMSGEAGPGSTLSLFGTGVWTGFGDDLEGGSLADLSSDGSNFVTLGDLGLALAFSLSGAEATLVINYDTQPLPPGTDLPTPGTLALGALALSIDAIRRRRHRSVAIRP